MSDKVISKMLDNSEHHCEMCGKLFFVYSPQYVYKCNSRNKGRVWFCGWNCQMAWERKTKDEYHKLRLEKQRIAQKKLRDKDEKKT